MVKGVPEALGPLVRDLRTSYGFRTQRALLDKAEAMGIGPSAGMLADVETGKKNLGTEKIMELAAVMGLDDDDHRRLLIAAGHDESPAALAARLTAVERAVAEVRAIVRSLQPPKRGQGR